MEPKQNSFFICISLLIVVVLLAGCTSSPSATPSTASTQATSSVAPNTTTQPPTTKPLTTTTQPAITTCSDGDGVCPTGCSTFTDNDCKALAPGTSADSGNLRLSVSNPHIEVCTSQYSEDKPYMVFDVSTENKGTKDTEYISSMEFTAVDPNRKQFAGSIISYPMAFDGNCKDAKTGSFSGGNLLPGSRDSGKVWIDLSQAGSYAKGKWFIVHKRTFSLKDIYTVYEAQIN